MKHLFLFELKKMIKSFYFIVMIIILIAFISAHFIYSYVKTERVEDYVHNNNVVKTSFQISLEDETFSEEDIEFSKNKIAELDMLSEAARNHDWKTIINYEMAIAEEFVTNLPSQKEENVYTWETHFTYEVVYEKNKWLLEHQIRPVFPIHISSEITAYDRVFDTALDEEIAYAFYNKHDSSSVYFLYLLIGSSLGIGGVIFFLFLFGNAITKEEIHRNGPLNFLDTQPLKRWQIIFSKFIAVILVTFLILAGTSIFAILLGAIFDRFGDWNYPVLVYEPDFSFRFMEMSYFILLSLLLFFFILIFCYCWLFFYSVLIKRTFMAIMFTILTLILGIQVSGTEIAMGQAIAPFNPFNYFQINDIITMEIALTADNFSFTIWNGIFSLVIFSFVLIIISYLVFRRRAT